MPPEALSDVRALFPGTPDEPVALAPVPGDPMVPDEAPIREAGGMDDPEGLLISEGSLSDGDRGEEEPPEEDWMCM